MRVVIFSNRLNSDSGPPRFVNYAIVRRIVKFTEKITMQDEFKSTTGSSSVQSSNAMLVYIVYVWDYIGGSVAVKTQLQFM